MSVYTSRGRQNMRASRFALAHILSCMSIDSDPVISLPRFGGDFAGDEKMPEIASIPCSSRARSSRVMPVFLRKLLVARTCIGGVCLFTFPVHRH